MAWSHDDAEGVIRCGSEKHGRNLTIKLPTSGEPPFYCRECWRNCLFCVLSPEDLNRANRAAAAVLEGTPLTPRVMHFFNPTKPQ